MRLVIAGVVLLVVTSPAASQPTRAELVCAATATALVYDCTVRLSRGGQPLDGVEIVAGADMPSMPMTHNVRQVAAAPGPAPGEYTSFGSPWRCSASGRSSCDSAARSAIS